MRRIQKARVKFISMVPRGANRMPVIFKADDQTLDLDMLMKADMEKGEVHAIVYAPEIRDSQGDIASAEVIKDMMYEAARDGVDIDVRHDGAALSKDQAFVAESFIVQKNDPRFEGMKTYDGTPVDPAGSWGVVMKVEDPVLRQKFRDGEWNGVSMGGTAQVVSEKTDDRLDDILDRMSKALGVGTNEDIDMTKDELAAVLAESNKSLVSEIVKSLPKAPEAPAATPPVEAKKEEPAAPIFKGDPTSEDDLLGFQKQLALFNIRKSVDWACPESVGTYMAKLAEFKEEFGDIEPTPTKKARTNQPVNTSKEDTDLGDFHGVSKADLECAAAGVEMAKWANSQRFGS